MYDYIQIGTWKSDSVPDLHVMEWSMPLLSKAARPTTSLPGRLTALEEGLREYKPEPIEVTLAMVGSSRQEIRQKLASVLPTLWSADHLTLSDSQGKHYRGHITEVKPQEDLEEWLSMKLVFLANPPCQLRTLGPKAGWIPDPKIPIAEQITEVNATHNLHLDRPQTLVIGDGPAAYAPEIHMLLIGSWDRLQIGGPQGLTIPGLGLASAVYLDCERMQVYDKVDGKRRPVPDCSGDFSEIGRVPNLAFDGLNLNLTAHILVIERS